MGAATPVEETLYTAVVDSQELTLTYSDAEGTVTVFVFEPYIIYAGKSDVYYCHGWKVSGEYVTEPPPHWCNLVVDRIQTAHPTGRSFLAPQPGYNPRNRLFRKIIAENLDRN